MLFQIFAHVQTDQAALAGPELFRQGLCQAGLAHAAGAAEQKAAQGPLPAGEGASPHHGPGHLLHGLALAEHLPGQRLLQPQHPQSALAAALPGSAPEDAGHPLHVLLRHPERAVHGGAGRRLVHQIHRPVGVGPPHDAPGRKLRRRRQGAVGDGDAVMPLVPGPQRPENDGGLLRRGLPHLHRPEPPRQRAVPADVFFELRPGGGADDLKSAPGQGRLQQVARVDGPLGGARAADGVQLVDEQDHIPRRPDLAEHGAHPLLELAPVFGARHHARQTEGDHPLAQQAGGRLPLGDPLDQALHQGGLAHAGGAQQHGVALLPPGQDLHDPPDLSVPAGHRVVSPRHGPGGHVLSELQGQLQLPAGAVPGGTGTLLQPAAQGIALGTAPAQDVRTRAGGILQQRQQQPPCGDDAVGGCQCRRLLDDRRALFGQGGGHIPVLLPVHKADHHLLGLQGKGAVLLMQGAQQQVLRPDGPVAQPLCRLIGPDQRPLSAL